MNFFAKAGPIPPSSPLYFELRCNTENLQNPLKMFMPNGFKEYYWTNGFSDITNKASLETSTGFYRGRAVDYLGNVSGYYKFQFLGNQMSFFASSIGAEAGFNPLLVIFGGLISHVSVPVYTSIHWLCSKEYNKK